MRHPGISTNTGHLQVPDQETLPGFLNPIFGGVNPEKSDGQKGITGQGGNLFSNIFDSASCLVSGFLGGGNPNCKGKGSAVAPGTATPSGAAGGAPGATASGAPGASAGGAPGAAATGAPGGAPGASASGAPGGAPGASASGAPGAAASGAPGGAPGASASGAPGAAASGAPGGAPGGDNSSSQSTRYTYNYSTNDDGKLEVDVKLQNGRMCHYTIDAQGQDVKKAIAAEAQKCIAQGK